MKKLAPDLFQLRYDDLLEIGRARLPELTPEWTDHNAHDPGITLMELLAWTSEAQLYSLSRLRRDERRAYASLVGIDSRGSRPAKGLIWPDETNPNSPALNRSRSVALNQGSLINPVNSKEPVFRPIAPILFVPGEIASLESRANNSGSSSTDFTETNRRGGTTFYPFGIRSGKKECLEMKFSCRDPNGIFGPDRIERQKAFWPIGIEAAEDASSSKPTDYDNVDSIDLLHTQSPLEVTFVAGSFRTKVNVVMDSSLGFLKTGVILLDLNSIVGSPQEFSIEFRVPSGFPRPPRILKIRPNVIPIEQLQQIDREVHSDIKGWPDLVIQLQQSGLSFIDADSAVTVEVAESNGFVSTWKQCSRLVDHGPDDKVFELNPESNEITFGNGVNGYCPPQGSQVWVSYSVSDGDKGNVARNREWEIAGFQYPFGINRHAVTGGKTVAGWIEQRREARRRTSEDRALITADDIVATALKIPLLEIDRAWIAQPEVSSRVNSITLVALRRRNETEGDVGQPETSRWLNAIHRKLAPKLLMGARLNVIAPSYHDFTIVAQLESDARLEPTSIGKAVKEQLRSRLALTSRENVQVLRQPGIPLTTRDIAAWILSCAGVKRILQLELRDEAGDLLETGLSIPTAGLPRWNEADSSIDVIRPKTERTSP